MKKVTSKNIHSSNNSDKVEEDSRIQGEDRIHKREAEKKVNEKNKRQNFQNAEKGNLNY